MAKNDMVEMPAPARRLLRIKVTADYLSCTNWWMEEALRNGIIPFRTLGKRRVIDVKDLYAFVDNQKTKAA